MKILGLISGTSHDGVDAAVVDFRLSGDTLEGKLVHASGTPYPPQLRERLVGALPPAPTTMAEVCELDTLIGRFFADVALATISDAGPVELIVSHGQTMFHWVTDDHAEGTLQLGQPAWIAEAAETPVLSDVRIRDITAGGHGAPLVSYLDTLLLAAHSGTAAALNLGGISNMTVRNSDDHVVAFDIGPANALIDAVVQSCALTDVGYDEDGRLAAQGAVDDRLLAYLLDEPYYCLPAPKSTGKELFNLAYVEHALESAGRSPDPKDLIATLAELTVRTVAQQAIDHAVEMMIVSGGGARNPVLVEGLRKQLPGVEIKLSDDYGAPADDKEAIAFALIGWCSLHGLPGTVPAGTGARSSRVLGSLQPGSGPLVLPQPLPTPPRRLILSA